jgi:hypothetical protein
MCILGAELDKKTHLHTFGMHAEYKGRHLFASFILFLPQMCPFSNAQNRL